MSPYSVRSAIESLPDDQRQRLLSSSLPSTHRRVSDDDDLSGGDYDPDRPY